MLAVETGEFLRSRPKTWATSWSACTRAARSTCAKWPGGGRRAQLPQRYVWFTPGAAAGGGFGGRRPGLPGGDDHRDQEARRKRGRRGRAARVRGWTTCATPSSRPSRWHHARLRQTAADKANKLIQKLAFATGSVILLVGLALGRREAVIVGAAVILTLTATLFASWAWGFTLNRVSLFALIFSIGILVDDAIVVVENIHRHRQLTPDGRWRDHPARGGRGRRPTILATLTVIAALLPMAFVSGLMGPYMSPIPINASMGMALSLAIAFTVTPWLALKLMKTRPTGHAARTRPPPRQAHGRTPAAPVHPAAHALSCTARASAGCCWPASWRRWRCRWG
jgi:hypothetical protein